MQQIKAGFEALNKKYYSLLTERDLLNKSIAEINNKINALEIVPLTETVAILQAMSSERREMARKRLEELGTLALQYSLGAEYSMIIEVIDGTKPKADVFIYNSKTKFKTRPETANGGGVIDILSMAMRFVVMATLHDPQIDGPMILDEPFKMVSEDFVPKIVDFISKISKDFDCQFIIVTHNNYLAASCEQIVRVVLDDDGVSHVKVEG